MNWLKFNCWNTWFLQTVVTPTLCNFKFHYSAYKKLFRCGISYAWIMMTKCSPMTLQLRNMLSQHKLRDLLCLGDTRALSHREKKTEWFTYSTCWFSWKPPHCLCFWNGKSISYQLQTIPALPFSVYAVVPTLLPHLPHPPTPSLISTQEKWHQLIWRYNMVLRNRLTQNIVETARTTLNGT